MRLAFPGVLVGDCARATEVIAGMVVADLIAVGMEIDAPTDGENVMVTGIRMRDASVNVWIEVP